MVAVRILAEMLTLAQARLHRGLSIRALAEQTGLKPSTVWRIETGRQRPRPSTRLALATALRLSIAEVKELANGGRGSDDLHGGA